MKATLKGEDVSNIYDVTDRVIDELSLAREKKKLAKIFGSNEQISEAFSSVKNISLVQEEMKFEEVDSELLSDYSFVKSREENVDKVDFMRHFLFGRELKTKQERIIDNELFHNVVIDYQLKHFDILKVTKEAIEMNSSLLRLFKERKLVGLFDELLIEYYGMQL